MTIKRFLTLGAACVVSLLTVLALSAFAESHGADTAHTVKVPLLSEVTP